MSIHTNVVGIDVSKHHLDLFDARSCKLHRIDNADAAIDALLNALQRDDLLVVYEATGRYDRRLTRALDGRGIARSRVNPSQARDFTRARGQLAKTDRLDARSLAEMGQRMPLRIDRPVCAKRYKLADMIARRDQLTAIQAQEKTRIAEDVDPQVKANLQQHIDWLEEQIRTYNRSIKDLIAETEDMAEQAALMQSVPGVGPVTTSVLLAYVPELGTRSRRTIAALAGVAPINADSGKKHGKRRIRGGRARVRKALYMAAVSAVRSNAKFKAKYDLIRQKADSAKVALIAIARQLLVILNAIVRNRQTFQKQKQ